LGRWARKRQRRGKCGMDGNGKEKKEAAIQHQMMGLGGGGGEKRVSISIIFTRRFTPRRWFFELSSLFSGPKIDTFKTAAAIKKRSARRIIAANISLLINPH
jgi:hypothetical protein